MQTEKRKFKGLTMRKVELMVGLLPIITCALAIVIFANIELRNIMYEDAEERLKAVAVATKLNIESNGALKEAQLYLDTIAEDGMEMTIINGATRAITTLKDENGEYITGTDIDSEILSVLKRGESYSHQDVVISGKDYIVYYEPLIVEGEYAGAVFAGYNKEITDNSIANVSNTFVILTGIVGLICTILIIFVVRIICSRINDIIGGLERMAEGDLSDMSIGIQHIYELDEMKKSLESLNARFINVVGIVSNTAAKLDGITDSVSEKCTIATQAASDIGSASEEIANGTTNLADNTQTMNSELVDMGEHIDTIKEKVEGAYVSTTDAANTTIKLVQNLGALMSANSETKVHTDAVVQSIRETADAIDAIGEAATFIESIAGQTNLLSLNASIEAARAGDAGRGFAVVAGEIKNLAEQSAKSANNVQTIIKTIMEKSQHSTESAKAISDAVESEMELLHVVRDGVSDVKDSVDDVNMDMSAVKDITEAMDKEKTSILDGIQSLSSISQENAAITEETNATVEELHANMEIINEQAKDVADQSKELVETIKFFKI